MKSRNWIDDMKNKKYDLYLVNPKLKKVLEKQVKKHIAEEYREEALYILLNCDEETLMKFLFFSFSDNGLLTCTCLDFAKDKNGNKFDTIYFKEPEL